MSKPEMQVGPGVYLFTWSVELVSVRLDRIREDSRYNVSAEALIRTTAPGTASHLHQARVNLTSTTSRRSLAKYLEARMPGQDWAGMLEQACVMALNEFRQGDPPVRVMDIPQKERLVYRLEPLLVAGQINLWYGAGGTAKSYMAQYTATLMACPFSHSGFSPEPSKVLYMDYETDPQDFGVRVGAIHKGLELEGGSEILYRFCKHPLAQDAEEVQRIITESKVDVLILDSVGMACGEDPERAESVLAYFRALRSLGNITSLSIDHLNKEGKLFGSVYKFNEARNIWEFRKVQNPGDNTLDVGLYHRKRNSAGLRKPLGFHLQFAPGEPTESVVFQKQEVKAVPELAKGLPLREQIIAALTRGAMSAEEIAEEVEISQAVARATLNRYRGKTFIKVGDDWGLRQAEA